MPVTILGNFYITGEFCYIDSKYTVNFNKFVGFVASIPTYR